MALGAGRRMLLEGGVSDGSPLEYETELLAWAVLRASNRTQARGTTVRLVVPRAPEVIYDLGMEGVAEERIVEYLEVREVICGETGDYILRV